MDAVRAKARAEPVRHGRHPGLHRFDCQIAHEEALIVSIIGNYNFSAGAAWSWGLSAAREVRQNYVNCRKDIARKWLKP